MRILFFGAGALGSIDGWLKYHVALVSPLVGALYKYACDNHRAARDEMLELTSGFQTLVEQTPLRTPSIDLLRAYAEEYSAAGSMHEPLRQNASGTVPTL